MLYRRAGSHLMLHECDEGYARKDKKTLHLCIKTGINALFGDLDSAK